VDSVEKWAKLQGAIEQARAMKRASMKIDDTKNLSKKLAKQKPEVVVTEEPEKAGEKKESGEGGEANKEEGTT